VWKSLLSPRQRREAASDAVSTDACRSGCHSGLLPCSLGDTKDSRSSRTVALPDGFVTARSRRLAVLRQLLLKYNISGLYIMFNVDGFFFNS